MVLGPHVQKHHLRDFELHETEAFLLPQRRPFPVGSCLLARPSLPFQARSHVHRWPHPVEPLLDSTPSHGNLSLITTTAAMDVDPAGRPTIAGPCATDQQGRTPRQTGLRLGSSAHTRPK